MCTTVFHRAGGAFSSALRVRTYSSTTRPPSAAGPRHLLSIADLGAEELVAVVKRASQIKSQVKTGTSPPSFSNGLVGKTVAMMFNKRSTRTRVSTEAAAQMQGGHPMFLGKDDIQLGVNECLLDTSKVISSMTSCMVARVGPHHDVAQLAKHSSVPIINALSDDFHPLQTIADFLTIYEEFVKTGDKLVPENFVVSWIGDANNVLYDLASGCVKLGVTIRIASPSGYGIGGQMLKLIESQRLGVATPGSVELYETPTHAVKDARVLFTDTWVSMGQEADAKKRLEAFEGYQVTSKLAEEGGAHADWRFMHCLPRHKEEVSDEVFYSPRSLVFAEAENRLWAAAAVLEAFVVNKGKLL